MKTIYKFPLAVVNKQRIEIARSAKILSIESQSNVLCIWALVDVDQPLKAREVLIYGTGHPILSDMALFDFVGTVQIHGGSLVWHVFIDKE